MLKMTRILVACAVPLWLSGCAQYHYPNASTLPLEFSAPRSQVGRADLHSFCAPADVAYCTAFGSQYTCMCTSPSVAEAAARGAFR